MASARAIRIHPEAPTITHDRIEHRPHPAFRPRRWRGALIPCERSVQIQVLDGTKRPVSATADSHEVRDVVEVTIRESRERTVTLLFDPEHNLEERILSEQFVV